MFFVFTESLHWCCQNITHHRGVVVLFFFFCYYCFIIFPTFVSLQQQDEEIIQEIQREGEAELTKKSAGEFRYTSICSVVMSGHHDMHRISIVRISKSFKA